MAGRRHSPAQIVLLLRRADEMLGHGRLVDAVADELGISPATFHRWQAQYGGIKAGDARRLAELEAENRRLRATVANLTLDMVMLRELLRTSTTEHDLRVDLIHALGTQFNTSQRRACQVVGESRSTVRRALTAVSGSGPDPGEFPDDGEIFSAKTFFADLHEIQGALG